MNLKKAPKILPLLPIRDVVLYPGSIVPLIIGREKSIRAIEEATLTHRAIFLSAQKKIQVEDPKTEDVFEVGTICNVLQSAKTPEGTLKVLVEGVKRARVIESPQNEKNFIEVNLEILEDEIEDDLELEALRRHALTQFEEYTKLNQRIAQDILPAVQMLEVANRTADGIASHLTIKLKDRQALLEITNIKLRLEMLITILDIEIELLNIDKKIQTRVRSSIDKNQKEHYLQEQMKAIQKELKKKDDFSREIQELSEKIKLAKMPEEAASIAKKECERLEKMMPYSPEATVVRSYLDWLVHLPWSVRTEDNLDLAHAEKILNEEHFGLEKAKERILEYMAVLNLVKTIKGPILCFVGPPGVGKTSLSRSVAHALGRNFIRISLGGVRDEAEIRGHRRTYIGSLPGKILQSMRKSNSKNPVFLLDEIDKMGTDWRGDPSSALLEVLDPEQNNNFVDHFLDIGFDLSEVLFITTANTLHNIPVSLQDRLEIMRFPGYTEKEKVGIAKGYLIPKQKKDHGLSTESFSLEEETLTHIVRSYTREAGVRNLDRQISKICRKTAKNISSKKNLDRKLEPVDLHDLLGVAEFQRENRIENEIGIATGLAWTELGGETLPIEINAMPGKGKFLLTGQLGNVMQESAQAALSYVKSSAEKFEIKNGFFKETDFHIHVPQGAVPKDGPSAGIAIGCALASLVQGKPIHKDLAMTGEITLRGNVLPIGGLKEKILAAHREGIKIIIFPEDNRKDLTEIPKEILDQLQLVSVRHMDQVLKAAIGN